MRRFSWQAYWKDRSDGGHRRSTADWLEREARGKLLLMGAGASLLDFGCGAGQLLEYYLPHFKRVIGVDFSPAMLSAARVRLAPALNAGSLQLIEADHATVWNLVPEKFTCVAAGTVLQYLRLPEVRVLLAGAAQHLEPGGRVVLLDIIDPRLFPLFRAGVFNHPRPTARTVLRGLARVAVESTRRRLRGEPASDMGYAHWPGELLRTAEDLGFHGELSWSMYYEYRYHLVLTQP